MVMYLLDFNEQFKCRMYDPEKKEKNELTLKNDIKTSGFSGNLHFGWAALYPLEDKLILEINNKSWDLLDDNVDTEYFHFYSEKKTRFQILNHDNVEFESVYKSWWADRSDFKVNEMAVSCEPENREEDDLAYINWIKHNTQKARNLHALWSKNAL